ncbi:DEAD/DEAH box helicase [Aquibacillus salsiterrae]|uniref:DEAD/DEAH box helicase n=1 Tax=Aquibacillus salsiterrae TaxID=2950439 RepID=A0A9X3WH98_9BACI|nr:DEAD/DEAH box helicase [Aquibacillus salsiterrae]MDC3417409.1 DEAD/DEAH box helicase [Aquibacillus salsiterrae]
MSLLQELFHEEPKQFLKDAWDKAGFETATAIQTKAVPLIQQGKDVIAEAPTGTGKTLAYLLPILQTIDLKKIPIQAIIIASSHELVMQIHQQIQVWGEASGIRSTALIGGANIKRQIEKLKKHPHVVVGTPGRLEDLINQKKLKLHEVKTVVLDEADQLLVPGHERTVEGIIKRTDKERQLLVFSATVSQEMEEIAKYYTNNPEVIRITETDTNKPSVNHYYIVTEERDKLEMVRKLSNINGIRALVFARDIGNMAVMADKLTFKGVKLATLHSDVRKQERQKAISAINNGEVSLLLATDVAARGLDINDVTHVIQLDVPKDNAQYIHRSGRTGRLGSTTNGTVISIVTKQEAEKLMRITRKLNISVSERVFYKGQLRER